MRFAATALLVYLFAATTLTQSVTVSPADRDLIMRFVSADEPDRIALISSDTRITESSFLEALANAGNIQETNGNLDAAEACYRALLFIGDRRQLPRTISIADNNLGIVYGRRGDLPQATHWLNLAMEISEKSGDIKGVQSAWANLGITERRLGELDLAETSVRKALAYADQMGDKGMAAKTLNTLGMIYNNRGDGAAAQGFLLDSLRLKEESGADAKEMAVTLSNLGGIFDEQGDYPQAILQYERGLTLMEKDGRPDSAMISTLNNLGHSYAAVGRNSEALGLYTRGLAAAERSGERAVMATLLANLGTLARVDGRLDEAEDYQRRALAIRESLSDRLGLVESLTNVGHLLDYRGRGAEGLPYVMRAISLADQSRLLNQLWKAQYEAGHIQVSLGDTDAAAALYASSIQTIEKLRQAAAGGDAGRRQFLFERVGPYYGLATLKASKGDGWAALSVIEQARARALIDIIATGREPTRSLTGAQLEQEHTLLQTIASLSDTIDTESRKARLNAERLASLDTQLTKARVARDAFTAELYAEQPGLRLARGNPPEITRAELASLVTPSTAVVTFVLDVDGPWVYVIRRKDNDVIITTRKLALTRTALESMADTFATRVASRDLGFTSSARDLYKALLGPIDAELAGVTNVVLVPDGPLWNVPFQALLTPRGAFMLEEHAISYTPSLSALAALEVRRASRGTRAPYLLALGDPLLSASGPTATTRSGTGPLPQAAREVEALGRLYGPSRSRVLTEAAASETALRTNLARASVVHLATHGIFDDRNPMYSRLLLTPDRANAAGGAALDHTADGRLEAWEILELGITADLAVLSACKTARGSFGGGEGVIGLSWSIFAAGASTAVVSQWEVDSTSTTRLMIAFYQQRLRSTSSNESSALRTAALSVMKNPAYRHPFYWAGFISVGAR